MKIFFFCEESYLYDMSIWTTHISDELRSLKHNLSSDPKQSHLIFDFHSLFPTLLQLMNENNVANLDIEHARSAVNAIFC